MTSNALYMLQRSRDLKLSNRRVGADIKFAKDTAADAADAAAPTPRSQEIAAATNRCPTITAAHSQFSATSNRRIDIEL